MTSEASFQRFIASHAELPVPFYPRTPRNARGRFPEEVGGDDDEEDERDMSDDDDDFASVIGTSGLGGGESIADDTAWMVGSPAGPGIMDVEMVCISSIYIMQTLIHLVSLRVPARTALLPSLPSADS